MDRLTAAVAAGHRCDVCGRQGPPRRLRLSLAKLAVALPIELLLHALALWLHPPFLAAVVMLGVSKAVLVVWVLEPSAMRLLGKWLHAPRRTYDIPATTALWRIRAEVDDRPGALERLTHGLTTIKANILGLHLHPLDSGALDEFVVSAPDWVGPDELREAVEAGGGRNARVWPTSALALVDGQTKALTLAAGLIADPDELPHAVATMLGARVLPDLPDNRDLPSEYLLKIPSPWSGLYAFTRDGEPFTPAESARAYRLAQIAEAAVAVRRPHPDAQH